MDFDSLFNKVQSAKRLESMSIAERTVKVQEECGELAAEVLRFLGKKVPKNDTVGCILEEGSDVILTVLSVFSYFDFSKDDVISTIDKKLDKWIKKITTGKANKKMVKLFKKATGSKV